MTGPDGNLLSGLPAGVTDELVIELAGAGGARIERIVSPPGYASPDGFWYDQPHAEWVSVLAGSAGVLFEGEAEPRRLGPGDHLLIEAHCRHRVAWTDVSTPTIWLAVHFATGL